MLPAQALGEEGRWSRARWVEARPTARRDLSRLSWYYEDTGGGPTEIRVRHESGDRYRVEVGHHAFVVDQPGSGDAGPTPTDLFVASLASCVAHYAGRFLARHAIDPEALGVDCSFEMADRPARVGTIELRLLLPADFPHELRDRLAAVVEHCTVHNSIVTAPDVHFALETSATPDGRQGESRSIRQPERSLASTL